MPGAVLTVLNGIKSTFSLGRRLKPQRKVHHPSPTPWRLRHGLTHRPNNKRGGHVVRDYERAPIPHCVNASHLDHLPEQRARAMKPEVVGKIYKHLRALLSDQRTVEVRREEIRA